MWKNRERTATNEKMIVNAIIRLNTVVVAEVTAVFGLGNTVLHTNEKYHRVFRTKLQPSVGKNSYD